MTTRDFLAEVAELTARYLQIDDPANRLFLFGGMAGVARLAAKETEEARRELSRRPPHRSGCAVCGEAILADTEDWPAPLCPAHAPNDVLSLLDAIIALSEYRGAGLAEKAFRLIADWKEGLDRKTGK